MIVVGIMLMFHTIGQSVVLSIKIPLAEAPKVILIVGGRMVSEHIEFDEISETCILEFDGVYEDSTVWVNGIKVGGWAYGYSGFFLDITPYINVGRMLLQLGGQYT